jgi:hypothetical protein
MYRDETKEAVRELIVSLEVAMKGANLASARDDFYTLGTLVDLLSAVYKTKGVQTPTFKPFTLYRWTR